MAISVREHVAERSRGEILRAAAQCFLDQGYVAASIDDVARRIGATKGMIYHHYPSKADLFADVFRVGMEMNYAAVEPLSHGPGPAARRWRVMAQAHTRQMIATKAFQRVVWEGVSMYLRGATTPQQRDVLGELQRSRHDYGLMFRREIEAARTDGDFTFGDLGIAEQVMFLALNSPLFWYSPRPGETEADLARIVAEVVDFAERGLGGGETKKE